MRLRIISCVLSYALIAACSDVSGPDQNQRRYVGYPPGVSINIPTITDWYQCWSMDDGQSWTCEYDRTDYGSPDYWDGFTFNTTAQCELGSQWARYCDYEFQPARSPYEAPRTLARASVSDNLLFIPTCPATSDSPPQVKAWCAGQTPNSTQLPRIQAALARMHQIGGICDELATIGDAVLSRGHLRVFPQSSYAFGGSAPLGGGSSGGLSWMIISQDLTDRIYDAAHMGTAKDPNSGNTYPATLQTILTHELDHLKGNNHITNPDGRPNLIMTPNMRACADFQW